MPRTTSQHKKLLLTFCDETQQSHEDNMHKLYHNAQLNSQDTVRSRVLLVISPCVCQIRAS